MTHIIIIIINPLTARVVGAPLMILQPVFSIFPCSPLPSGTCRTPGLSIPGCCLRTSSSVFLVFCPRPRGLTFSWWGCHGLCQRHKSTELANSFLFCSCVCLSLMAFSIVFQSINSSDNSPFSHSVLPVSSWTYWSFQLYVSL